ncbi:hypothetical protein [Streptomyces sp. NPDC059165]|uniref:HNH endonuclease n=1 Tax=Streptomyces sp. NPDC059165 TaxID=3346751 RepID=UPI003692A0EF
MRADAPHRPGRPHDQPDDDRARPCRPGRRRRVPTECGAVEPSLAEHVQVVGFEGPPSDWARVMLDRRRKTLVACTVCHDRIHEARTAGSPTS